MFVSRAWHALIVAGVLLSCAESSHAADVAKWHRLAANVKQTGLALSTRTSQPRP